LGHRAQSLWDWFFAEISFRMVASFTCFVKWRGKLKTISIGRHFEVENEDVGRVFNHG